MQTYHYKRLHKAALQTNLAKKSSDAIKAETATIKARKGYEYTTRFTKHNTIR